MASYEAGKTRIVYWVKNNFEKGSTCLDVGPCDGVWGWLLADYLKMSAVEVYEPNIINHKLDDLYEVVYLSDIQQLRYKKYDLIIFGDILEHLTVPEAQKVIWYAWERCKDMIVAVPYLYEQDAYDGNPYEVHKQPDLTAEIFNQRYPGFEPIVQYSNYCYYHKGQAENPFTLVQN